MASKKPYTIPQLIRSKSSRTKSGQDWYVEYFFEHPDRPGYFQSFKVRDGINYIHDQALKEIEAQGLLKDITNALIKENFDPFVDADKRQLDKTEKLISEKSKFSDGWSVLTGIEKYTIYINSLGLSDDSIRTYKKYLKSLQSWLDENNLGSALAEAFTEIQLESYLDDTSDDNDWQPRTYNNYLDFFITFFNKVEKLERKYNREHNPGKRTNYDCQTNDIEAKITRPQKNAAYSPILANSIKKQLALPGNEDLRDYIEWIFLSLMRPKEIINLKIHQIDEQSRQIRILGKTNDRIIPITDQLLRLIEKRGVLNMDPNWYVFGNQGKPGPVRASRIYFTKRYIKIKHKLLLPSNYGPYSWKATGVIAMINAGFTDEQIMVLTGHKTIEAFRTYKRDLVVDNSHVMKGNAVDF